MFYSYNCPDSAQEMIHVQLSDMNGPMLLEIIEQALELMRPEPDTVESECREAGSVKFAR